MTLPKYRPRMTNAILQSKLINREEQEEESIPFTTHFADKTQGMMSEKLFRIEHTLKVD